MVKQHSLAAKTPTIFDHFKKQQSGKYITINIHTLFYYKEKIRIHEFNFCPPEDESNLSDSTDSSDSDLQILPEIIWIVQRQQRHPIKKQ